VYLNSLSSTPCNDNNIISEYNIDIYLVDFLINNIIYSIKYNLLLPCFYKCGFRRGCPMSVIKSNIWACVNLKEKTYLYRF